MSRELLPDGEIVFLEEDLVQPRDRSSGCRRNFGTILLSILMLVLVAGIVITAGVYVSNEVMPQGEQRSLEATLNSLHATVFRGEWQATQIARDARSLQTAIGVTQGALETYTNLLEHTVTSVAVTQGVLETYAGILEQTVTSVAVTDTPMPAAATISALGQSTTAPYIFNIPDGLAIDEDFDFVSGVNLGIWDCIPEQWTINSWDLVTLHDNAWLLTRDTFYNGYLATIEFVPSERTGDYVFAIRTPGRMVRYFGALALVLWIEDDEQLSSRIYYVDSLDAEGGAFTFPRTASDGRELPIAARIDGSYQVTMSLHESRLSITLEGSTSQTWRYPYGLSGYPAQIGFQVPAGTRIRHIFIESL